MVGWWCRGAAAPARPPRPLRSRCRRPEGGVGGGGKDGTKETSFVPRFPLLGDGGNPQPGPHRLRGLREHQREGERERGRRRQRGRAEPRSARGEARRQRCCCLHPAQIYIIHTYRNIDESRIHTQRRGAPRAARSHGPATPEKAAETLFHPKSAFAAAGGIRPKSRPPAPLRREGAGPSRGRGARDGEGGRGEARALPAAPSPRSPRWPRTPGSPSAQTTRRDV